jgi:hypothetical protein
MKLASLALVLGTTVAVADSRPPSKPLVTRANRPAVGNIGQRGRPTYAALKGAIAASRATLAPPTRDALPPKSRRIQVERPQIQVERPLVNKEQRPAVGNCVSKCAD